MLHSSLKYDGPHVTCVIINYNKNIFVYVQEFPGISDHKDLHVTAPVHDLIYTMLQREQMSGLLANQARVENMIDLLNLR